MAQLDLREFKAKRAQQDLPAHKAMSVLQEREAQAELERDALVVKSRASDIFASPSDWVGGNLQGDIRTSTEGEPIGKEEQKQLWLGRETFSKQRWRTTCSKKPQTYGKIFREY